MVYFLAVVGSGGRCATVARSPNLIHRIGGRLRNPYSCDNECNSGLQNAQRFGQRDRLQLR